ncbi:unnamed protein product [Pseudo-nitzschia multistriata]|uniref:Uncharacterized protein n=1 Tax=Pseudo-nitzschia multistriata TaxID=183589 RepID=A0A448ZPB8_9STRA|nr:unnamed protein product [Pseudo-nitzschia multistriata]
MAAIAIPARTRSVPDDPRGRHRSPNRTRGRQGDKHKTGGGPFLDTEKLADRYALCQDRYEAFRFRYYHLGADLDANAKRTTDSADRGTKTNGEWIAETFWPGLELAEAILLDLPEAGGWDDGSCHTARAVAAGHASEALRLLLRILRWLEEEDRDSFHGVSAVVFRRRKRAWAEASKGGGHNDSLARCREYLEALRGLAREQSRGRWSTYEPMRRAVAGEWGWEPEPGRELEREPVLGSGLHKGRPHLAVGSSGKRGGENARASQGTSGFFRLDDCHAELCTGRSSVVCPLGLSLFRDDAREAPPPLPETSAAAAAGAGSWKNKHKRNHNDDDDDEARMGPPSPPRLLRASPGRAPGHDRPDPPGVRGLVGSPQLYVLHDTSSLLDEEEDEDSDRSGHRGSGRRRSRRWFAGAKASGRSRDHAATDAPLRQGGLASVFQKKQAFPAGAGTSGSTLHGHFPRTEPENFSYNHLSNFQAARGEEQGDDSELQEALYQSELEAARVASIGERMRFHQGTNSVSHPGDHGGRGKEREKRDDVAPAGHHPHCSSGSGNAVDQYRNNISSSSGGNDGGHRRRPRQGRQTVVVKGVPVPLDGRRGPVTTRPNTAAPTGAGASLHLEAATRGLRDDFFALVDRGRIDVAHVPTRQGRKHGSTNGCTVIAPLLCARHFATKTPLDRGGSNGNADPGLSERAIAEVIDVETPRVLPSIRKSLGLGRDAFLIPHDAHEALIEKGTMKRDQFVTVCGGNILDGDHLGVLVTELTTLRPGRKKLGATLFFHQHVVAILQLRCFRDQREVVWFDVIDSLPHGRTLRRPSAGSGQGAENAPPNAVRMRCRDVGALAAALRWYACSVFSSDHKRYIERHPWDETKAGVDPRVFQAFLWAEA